MNGGVHYTFNQKSAQFFFSKRYCNPNMTSNKIRIHTFFFALYTRCENFT